MILLIDNYDSFTFNVARYFVEMGESVQVVRNDAIEIAGIKALAPEAIIVSPGPGTPDDAGISMTVFRALAGHVPLLGVCLGHQCLGAAFGGSVERARRPLHGQSSSISHCCSGLFAGLPNPLTVGRYHSLIVNVPDDATDLDVLALSEEGEIMALAHRRFRAWGVQFHPESILTEHGHALFANFLTLARSDVNVLV